MKELERRIAKLEAAAPAIIEVQRRTSLRHLTPKQLDDYILSLAERVALEKPSSPIVAEVRACLDAGDRLAALELLGRVFPTNKTADDAAIVRPKI